MKSLKIWIAANQEICVFYIWQSARTLTLGFHIPPSTNMIIDPISVSSGANQPQIPQLCVAVLASPQRLRKLSRRDTAKKIRPRRKSTWLPSSWLIREDQGRLWHELLEDGLLKHHVMAHCRLFAGPHHWCHWKLTRNCRQCPAPVQNWCSWKLWFLSIFVFFVLVSINCYLLCEKHQKYQKLNQLSLPGFFQARQHAGNKAIVTLGVDFVATKPLQN